MRAKPFWAPKERFGIEARKPNRFKATLYLRGKQVNLGTYNTIEEAAEVRKQGEEKYFKPIIEEFERTWHTDIGDIK